MDALSAIESRHSTREYSDRPVERALLEKLIDAGRRAATARNEQPWEFVVVTEPATRRRIAELSEFGKFIAQAPACVAVFCRDTKYYLEDGSAASQNILVAATALGLASCWVAGDKKDYAPAIAELLGLPAGYKLISLLAIGYETRPAAPKRKREIKEVLHWERFGVRL